MRWLLPGIIAVVLSVRALAVELAPINGIANAEDMVVLNGTDWVIASSMAGGSRQQGALVAVNAVSGEHYPLYPLAEQSLGKSSTCPGELPAGQFAPHGIHLVTGSQGELQLYVVNHGGRESVEVFTVQPGPRPKVQWRDCIVLPEGVAANAVAVTDSGRLFITVTGKPFDGSKQQTLFDGEVLFWEAESGWQAIGNGKVMAANGIVTSLAGNTLYVASWTEREVIVLDLNSQRRHSIPLTFLPDNLYWDSDGRVLVAGHQTTAQAVMECYTSTQDHCDIASVIAVIDPGSLAVSCVIPVKQGMATVAVPVAKQLWLGTARGDSIERLPVAKVAPAQCP